MYYKKTANTEGIIATSRLVMPFWCEHNARRFAKGDYTSFRVLDHNIDFEILCFC